MELLNEALAERGYKTLTSVQEVVIAAELSEKDLVVSAETGSGKTVGFGLAIAPKLLGENKAFSSPGNPLALIIAPTRELAMQVKHELSWLYKKTGAIIVSCVGGMDMRDERRSLSKGAHIVVATPGRLRDHIMRKSLIMQQINTVVLDEADEMLDLGFQEDLEFIQSYKEFSELFDIDNIEDDIYSPWILRLIFDKESLMNKKITIQEIQEAIKENSHNDDDIECIYSDDNAQDVVMRI